MATYLIGDVQGCFDELKHLLDVMAFNPSVDRLGFVGDLINRGPKSLEVLRFVRSLDDALVVLGNHDLYGLAIGYGLIESQFAPTLSPLFQANDCLSLLDWFRQQPLLYTDVSGDWTMVHAGIPPQWSIEEALSHANAVSEQLRGPDYIAFLSNMEGDEPLTWRADLPEPDAWRYTINGLTRMRFCLEDGTLNLQEKSEHCALPLYQPWYHWRHDQHPIFFGHWAALKAQSSHAHCHALDSGCVYGGPLTAINVKTHERITA